MMLRPVCHVGLRINDLWLSIGALKLRWRDDKPKEASSTQGAGGSSDQMKLMELAFRLGQSSGSSSSKDKGPAPSSGSPQPASPMLAITDGSPEDPS